MNDNSIIKPSSSNNNKTKSTLKKIGVVAGAGALLLTDLSLKIFQDTNIVIGNMQNIAYSSESSNSYVSQTGSGYEILENGHFVIRGLSYGMEYPNSFLKITYPGQTVDNTLPTLIYVHGGGFFRGMNGEEDMDDPEKPAQMLDELCSQGMNVVMIDYALVPDYKFPVPLIQLNQAVKYLSENSVNLGINMDDVYIMGSSAGGSVVAQYGALLSNPNYVEILNIAPAIDYDKVSGIIIDDAPLDYSDLNVFYKICIGNYINGSVYLSDEELLKYNSVKQVTSRYPRTFLISSDVFHRDMIKMKKALERKGVDFEFEYPEYNYNEKSGHCYIFEMQENEMSKKSFDKLVSFIME